MALVLADCEFAAFDRPELASRVALELELPPTAVTFGAPPPDALTIRIDAPCAAREVSLTASRADRELARSNADLGDTTARARAWALAIVVAELVREAQRPPGDTLPAAAAPRRALRQATDDESPFRPYPARASRPASITVGAGPDFTLYLEQVTVAPGVRAGVTVDAFRVALGAFAMNVSNRLGSITYGGATLSLGARALIFSGGIGRLGAGFAFSGGLVRASGHEARPGVMASSAISTVGGVGGSMWAEWPLGRTLLFDAELAIGYDAGPSFEAGGDTVAALRGIRAGLLLTLATRL